MNNNPSKPTNKRAWLIAQRFLIIFIPLTALIAAITIFIYLNQTKTERLILETDENASVAFTLETISGEFDSIVSDLMILSDNSHLQLLLETKSVDHLRDLAKDFMIFSKRRKLYDQIRFLDDKGMEVVRVNFNSGNPNIIPEDQLQNKGKRYYFYDTFRLNRGEVFVSPFDLNIEQGKIEMPIKPMIRFGTPIFNKAGQKQGIVLLNYLGANWLNKLEHEHEHGNNISHVMLLNSEGFWLKSTSSQDEWGFMYENRRNRKFGKTFPEAWKKITAVGLGQFSNLKGMFTFATVYPLGEAMKSSTGSDKAFNPSSAQISGKDYHWKIVSYVAPAYFREVVWKTWRTLLFLGVPAIFVLAIVSWLLAKANIHRNQAEYALKQNRDTLNNILSASPIGIGLVEKRVFKWANEAMIKMFGLESEEDYKDKSTKEFYSSEDEYHRVGQTIYNKLKTGKSAEDDVTFKRKNGATFVGHVKMSCQDPSNPIEGAIFTISDISWRKQAEAEQEKLITELQTTLAEVKTLRGIIPICSNCKKIRDDEGYWQQVEKYIQDRSEAAFSHGICHECTKKLYPDLEVYDDK